ncbi:hypothetical protein ACIQU6_33975 [Streptomyces sp. NPDC090442]|uniref:hypothetical protein n=1 Tax=Streptomyces sp. NPDC090442 TaxID=3365962 RepID=UPI003812834F
MKQREERCEVELPVRGSVSVWDTDPLTYGRYLRDLRCARCGAVEDLVLRTRDTWGLLICPQGHAWRDPAAKAFGIRLLYARVRKIGQPGPHHDELRGLDRDAGASPSWVVPLLSEPRDAVAPDDDASISAARLQWTIDGALGEPDQPPLTQAMYWARALLTWAFPRDPVTWAMVKREQLALDAHMVMVVLGLALYEYGYAASTADLQTLPLTAPLEMLEDTEQRNLLRRVRPSGLQRVGGTLRVTDRDRLANCSPAQWAYWCDVAASVLSASLQDARIDAAAEHGGRVELPDAGTRLSRRRDKADIAPEDWYTWYTVPVE